MAIHVYSEILMYDQIPLSDVSENASAPLEQIASHFVFEHFDLESDGGLRQVELLARLAKAEVLRHGPKNTEPKVHQHSTDTPV